MPDGKWVSSWKDRDGRQQSGIVSMFEAHQPDGVERRPHPAAKRVLSLRQNDLVAVEPNGQDRKIMRVVKFSGGGQIRSEEHTSELQSLMRISYAVFCLKKKII